jgi:4-amino-4-deoxy-L-arabinose transferase-like glycosyltransferase
LNCSMAVLISSNRTFGTHDWLFFRLSQFVPTHVSMETTISSRPVGHEDLDPQTSMLPGRSFRIQLIAPLLIVVVGGLVPVAIAWHFGALGVPKNDDWSYALSAFRFAHSGALNGNNWAAMSLVGQLILAAPIVWVFGYSITALQLEVVILGVVGLLAIFDLAKHVISPKRALFVTLMVALGPMWTSLSVSFMTDVPAFSLAMVSLALGARGVDQDGVKANFFWSSLAVGFVAFTVREYAIVAPLAVILSAMLVERRSRPGLVRAGFTLLGVLILAVVFLRWRGSLPGFQSLTPLRPHLSSIKATASEGLQSAVLVGLLVAPAVFLAGPWRLLTKSWNRAPRATVGAVIVSAAGLIAENATRVSHGFIGPGDYVLPNGSLGNALIPGMRSDLLPVGILTALAIVGLLSAVVLCAACVPIAADVWTRIRKRDVSVRGSVVVTILALSVCGYIAAILLPLLAELNFWDRYVLPLVPILGILVLLAPGERGPSQTSRVMGTGALVILAVVGMIYAANAASYDGSTWHTATRAAQIAGSPQKVNGGFAWNNFQAGTFIFSAFTFDYTRNEHSCIVIRIETEPSTNAATVLPITSVWGPFGSEAWVEAQRTGKC